MGAISTVYTKNKQQLAQGAINLTSDTLKYMLLTSSYTPAFDSDAVYSDISANEVVGTGYSAGGVTLAGASISQVAANSWTQSWAALTAYSVGQIVKPTVGNGFLYKCVVAGTSGGGVAPTAATNASPAVVTAAAHGLSTGNRITLSGITGETNLNADAFVVVQSSSTYELMNPSTLVLINGNGVFGGSPAIVNSWPTVVGTTITDGTVTWLCIGTSAIKFTFTAPSWASSTITARYGVVYDSTASNKLLVCQDYGGNITSTNGTFAVTVDSAAGVLDLY